MQRGRVRIAVGAWLALVVASLPLRAVELDIPVALGGFGLGFYEETARAFEELRPDVTIRLYGDPRITDRLRIRIIDGDLPDAAMPLNLLIPTLARAGRLVDLRPALDGLNWEGDARWGDTFLPGALNSWVIDDGVYGLPFGYAAWTLFFNRAMFRENGWEEPRTWDEFFALCERIRAAGIAPVSLTGIYGNYPDAFLRSAFYSLAGSDGWRAINELEPGARLDPRYERAAAVLRRITQEFTLRGWEGATHTAAQLAFLQGQSAMTVSGSWMINEMAGRIPEGFEIGSMNFPVFPEGVADPTTIQAGADNFFLFATGDPERERATVDFFRFMTSRARAEAFVRRVDAPVAVRGVPIDAFSPAMRSTAEMIANSRDSFNMPQQMLQPPVIRQALVDSRLRLMTGRIDAATFAREIEAAAGIDRARAAQPDFVESRHPWAAWSLLALLAGAVAWSIRNLLRSRGKAARTGDDSHFGTLRHRAAAGFVGPALVLYAVLVLAPGMAAFAWAFSRWDGLSERTWAGGFNFRWLLFESDVFWAALRNNLFLMVVPAAVVLPVALGFAYLLHRGIWGARVFRAVFLFPNLLGGIAATMLWMSAYEPNGGLVNAGLVALGDLVGSDWLRSFAGHPWLSADNLYLSLVPIYLWMACGFNLILYLAAMEGIDPQLYEAAQLDGASRLRQFFSITLPLIREIIAVSVVFLVIGGLSAFEMIWLLTSQNPTTATHTLGTLMVTTMFNEFQVGRATAVAVVLFALVFAGSALAFRLVRKEAVEQ
jgi:ABC-type sugar transport system permease subunit/ABC-type glycerol-3-phosphate transport system substrate-binding protein